MVDSTEFVFLNKALLKKDDAKITAGTAGLYYGAGCFETCLTDNNRIFDFSAHVERLNCGLNYLGLSKQYHVKESELREQITELVQKNNLSDKLAKVRIQVSLTDEGGYSVNDDLLPILYITAAEQKSVKKEISLKTVDTRVVPASAKPARFKLSNMLHYRKAAQEGKSEGFDDGLMLTTTDHIAETSISNIFWLKGKTVYTPSDECDILPGIMRNAVLHVAAKTEDFQVKTGKFNLSEISDAEAVWCTNSVMNVVPVSKIDTLNYEVNHPVFKSLQHSLNRYIQERLE